MKNYIYIILSFGTLLCYSQEPPAIFKLKYSLLNTDSNHLVSAYRINSPSLDYYKKSKNAYLTESYWDNYKDRIRIDDEFAYLYMGNPFPRENDIIILNIFRKDDIKMSIFIKINFDLDFGEFLYLKGLKFAEGNFFIDLSQSKKEINNLYISNYNKKEVDLSNIEVYKISSKNLDHKFIK
ncbi:hypothetical protein [Flavobacterium sp. LHD-85]|uniref:hypothetical protein n=1 Tax=Flavobacterium sp. LHD-85 TaxID=3071410 RepID=UPI0027DEF16C|nr:hypothetical protein [Flavobacterium sp. LHD-85]MDQ6531026.1 hypothetical protein [Flavobacterium sp. LHD-85]